MTKKRYEKNILKIFHKKEEFNKKNEEKLKNNEKSFIQLETKLIAAKIKNENKVCDKEKKIDKWYHHKSNQVHNSHEKIIKRIEKYKLDESKKSRKINYAIRHRDKALDTIYKQYEFEKKKINRRKKYLNDEFEWQINDFKESSIIALEKNKLVSNEKFAMQESKNKFLYDRTCKKEELKSKLDSISNNENKKEIINQINSLNQDMYDTNNYLYKPWQLKVKNILETVPLIISNGLCEIINKFKLLKYKSFKEFARIKVWGCPLYLYAVLLTIVLVCIFTKLVKAEMIAGISVLFVVSMVIGSIFENIAFFKTYLGGGAITCFIIAGLLGNTFDVFPESVLNNVKAFFSSTKGGGGLLNLYITILLCGAIVTLPKKLVLISFGRYGIFLLLTVLISGCIGFGLAKAVGLSTSSALLDMLAPIFGDGNGGGAVPMADIAYSSGYAKNRDDYYAKILAVVVLSNIFMIMSSGITAKCLGNSKHSGNGKLLKKGIFLEQVEDKSKDRHVTISLVLFCCILLASHAIEKVIADNTISDTFPKGIIISQFAWAVLIALIINLVGIIPEEIKQGGQKLSNYFTKEFTWIIMTGVGLGIDFKVFASNFDPKIIYGTIITNLALLLTPWFLSSLFGTFKFESMIALGSCMGAMGGGGAVACMTASNRMQLMPYSQISCRIGGSLILIVVSPLYAVFAN